MKYLFFIFITTKENKLITFLLYLTKKQLKELNNQRLSKERLS